MEEMKPDTEVKEETSVPEEGAAEATAEKPKKEKGTMLQLVLFIALSIIACVVQMLIINYLPMAIKDDREIQAWIFTQPLNSLIGFLVGNVVAKLLSYFLNRKATFGARKHFAFSMTVYVILCVVLIIVETLIGEPLKQAYLGVLGDPIRNCGIAFFAEDPEGWCNILSIITYSCADLIIVFIMNKLVIMNDHIFDRWEKKEEAVAAADETAVAVDETAAVEVPVVADEAVAEEAPAAAAEEAPVEQAAEETAAEEAQSEEAVEEVAEAVEEATPVEEVVTEEPLAETPQEEQAIAEAEAVEDQTPSDEAPAAIEEAPVEEVAAEEPVAEEAQEAVAEEAPVEEAAPAEEAVAEAAPEAVAEEEVAAAAPVEEKPAKKAPAKKPAAKKAADKKPAAKKSDAKKPAAKKSAPKKEEPKKEEAKEAAPSNVTVLFEAPDTDSPKGKFVVIKDDLNPDRPYKFQLKANNGQVLYESESFKIKPRAKQIEVFRNTINNGTSTIDSEKNGTFRYKLFKADGSLYGVGEGYKTRASAESALESVKNFCNTSNVLEDTTVEDKK